MSLWESPYKQALMELLRIPNDKTLEALALTATSNRLLPVNRKESIELILRYTNNLARLFSYKKMTLQVLVDYLHKKKVTVRSGASKTELIDLAREELERSIKASKTSVEKFSKSDSEGTKTQVSRLSKSSVARPPPPSPSSPSVNVSLSTSTKNAAVNLSVNAAAERVSLGVQLREPQPSPHHWPSSPSTNLSLTTATTHATVSFGVQQGGSGVVSGSGGGEESEVFAREFCQWFYTMLNRLQPEACHLVGDSLSVDAFVANCSVDIYLYTGQQVIEKHGVGQQNAFTTLRDTLLECAVCFAPNTDKRPCCEVSNFGMVKLQCCGTLHRYQAVVGIFEQEFGLVKCPNGRWKVMVLKLNLKQGGPQCINC